MMYFLLLLSILYLSAALAQNPGVYVLLEVLDESGEPIDYPKGKYKLTMELQEDGNGEKETRTYDMRLVIGNTMGTTAILGPDDGAASAQPVWSTKMFPGEAKLELETTVASILSDLTSIVQEGNILTIDAEKVGTLVFEKVDLQDEGNDKLARKKRKRQRLRKIQRQEQRRENRSQP